MNGPPPDRVRFGVFELDLRAGELHQDGQTVLLQEQPLQVLRMLVVRAGELVTREEIQKKLWPNDTVVEFDHGINTAIQKLRQALGDSADKPTYIQTVARRGYRLIATVQRAESSSPDRPDEEEVSSAPSEATGHIKIGTGTLIGKTVSHYRVLQVIGGGGMGVVYKAEDLKLGRAVALKLLPEEVGNDPRALERFEREARAASSLDHPNICAVYEFGEHENRPFMAMQLLEGQTLRDRMVVNGGALPLQELLEIGIQVSDGLQAAHEQGIIHRDIKPANLFITISRQVKILDFGLAKLASATKEIDGDALQVGADVAPGLQAAKTGPDVTLTRLGVAMGTAGYMSPEQVRGEKLDARTDIFSFGLVLYEMATGQRAFTGDTIPVVNDAILKSKPAPFPESNDKNISQLEVITQNALEKKRDQRYRSAAELGAELARLHSCAGQSKGRWWLWLAAALAALTVVLAIPHQRLPKQKHIAVLPFENIGNDAANQAFAEGVAESLTSKLSQLQRSQKSFWVVPSSDTRNLKGLDEAFRNLKVTLVVTGSIERTANGLNLTANLVDPKNHRQLASRSIHVNSADLDEMQQLVWESVVDMLDLRVSRETKNELAAGGTSQAIAYELYERGVGHLRSEDLEDINRAIPLFNQAIVDDPQYAQAYSSSTVTGPFVDAVGDEHGLLRDRSGSYTSFDAPGANGLTDPTGINSPGTVTGYFYDTNLALHGFVRANNGGITTLDVPGEGLGIFQGTEPLSISDGGAVTGVWTDSSNNNHGFVWISQ